MQSAEMHQDQTPSRMARLQLNASMHFQVIDSVCVVAVGETIQEAFVGRAYPRLVPLLDGRHDFGELIGLIADVSPLEIMQSIHTLKAKGCLVDAGTGGADPLRAFWNSLGAGADAALDRVARSSAQVRGLGGIDPRQMTDSLQDLGIRVAGDGDRLVVLTDHYLRDELAGINAAALAADRSWMLVKPVGTVLWIGPLFRPGETGCWECLAQRLRANAMIERFVQAQGRLPHPLPRSTASIPSLFRVACDLAATELLKAAGLGGGGSLDGAVISIDTRDLSRRRHHLVRRPQCPACGDPAAARRAGIAVELRSRRKDRVIDGGHRTSRPEQTYEKYKHHVSEITGVVRSIEQFGSGDGAGLVHSYSSGHNFALAQDDVRFLFQNLRSRSGGKGMTDVQARVSALCEAIERCSGMYQGQPPDRLASLAALGDDGVHPNALMCLSARQYERREALNRADQDGLHLVPRPFSEHETVEWTAVWSLTHGRVRYVPSAYCWFGHPEFAARFFCTSDGNGNAAGNTLEEAILQGFMELVERDSVALWWYNRVPRPAVDLDSFDDPYLPALRDHYRAAFGREFWVLDITADLEIPAFAAVSRRLGAACEDILLGFGAHFDPHVALLRAVTEMNQFLPAVSRTDGRGRTVYWFPQREAIQWWTTATLAGQPHLAPQPGRAPRRKAEFPDRATDDLRDDVALCVEVAARHGIETLVLDQTQPDIGLSVVKVMAPGLRHFWKRFGPGRLYDVPVRLGWCERATAEDDLNPIGIFF